MPAWLQSLAAVGGIAGIASLVVAIAALFRLGPERRKLAADAAATSGSADRDVRTELLEIYERLRKVETERDSLARQLVERDEERELLRLRVARLEAALPAALLAMRLTDLSADLCEVLDELPPVVITTPLDGGRFLWVNRSFAECLGVPREAVLASGWRLLIHPDDLQETTSAEASAWDGVVRVVNRYRHADGRYRTLRWCATRYYGVALAVVRVEGVVDSNSPGATA